MAHPYLLAGGGLLILLGVIFFRWASRYDLKGLALDAAWEVAKNRGKLNVETEIGNRFKELQAEGSNVNRARMVANHAARHFVAQAASIAAVICFVMGVGLIGLAWWWR